MSPICWSIFHCDHSANCQLSIPDAKYLLIHLGCIMAYIWDQLFAAFEAWADGTWDRVRSHEFIMCFIYPVPPCCGAQTAADVIECTFVNIYPGREPMKLREVHIRVRRWQSSRLGMNLNQPAFVNLRGHVEKALQQYSTFWFHRKAERKFKPKL